MKIQDIDLLKLQTNYLKNDNFIAGMCEGITPYLREAANKIKDRALWANIENQPESVLDQMAKDMSVKWYDFNASSEIKAQTIQSAITIHRFKGTKYALEKAIEDYFGEGYVKEWFEYNGEPYMFKVYTSSPEATTNKVKQFMKIIEYCKNARSHLEEIIVQTVINQNIYCGTVMQTRITCDI